MVVQSTLDMTIPLWGIFGIFAIGAARLLSTENKLNHIKEELDEFKSNYEKNQRMIMEFIVYGKKPKIDQI